MMIATKDCPNYIPSRNGGANGFDDGVCLYPKTCSFDPFMETCMVRKAPDYWGVAVAGLRAVRIGLYVAIAALLVLAVLR